MPQPKHPVLRIAVPLVVFLGGLAVVAAVFLNTGRQPPSPGAGAPPGSTQPPSPAATGPGSTAPSVPPAIAAQNPEASGQNPPSSAAPPPAPVAPSGLHARVVADTASSLVYDPLGALAPGTPFMAQLEFSPMGAGVRAIDLAHHFESIQRSAHVRVQEERVLRSTVRSADGAGNPVLEEYEPTLTPLGLTAVDIDGVRVDLTGIVKEPGQPVRRVGLWRQLEPGAFEAIIVDGGDAPVARIERRYELTPGTYELRLRQNLANLTDRPLRVRWYQFGPVDLPSDQVGATGDMRRVRFGYQLAPNVQGSDPAVLARDFLWFRAKAFGPVDKATAWYQPVSEVWPNPVSVRKEYRLVWAGMTNRYFGVALHRLMDPLATAPGSADKTFPLVRSVSRLLPVHDEARLDAPQSVVMALTLATEETTVAPGAALDVGMGVYAGPLSKAEIRGDALARHAGIEGLVAFNYGGMCGWCTFPFLTSFLFWLLHSLHDYVLHDWALAIIALVVVVRTLLHPVTRWSQIRMARFSAQIGAIAPKQKQVQERFKDDPKRMREEMARLWREEGISPTGALGCLPAFLQTPVWIALYATLMFAVELRHAPAFFGLFQAVWPGWSFLGDLSQPDRFIYFGRTLFIVPLLGVPFDAINILPLILAVVFYIQQKYLTPPSAAPLTPEQEQQQKIMKFMMVVLFPLMMYGQASGLALYFITNSSLGIAESHWIRAHIKKNDLLKPKPRPERGPGGPAGAGARPKAGPGGGGFLARLQAAAEERRKQIERARGMKREQKPGARRGR